MKNTVLTPILKLIGYAILGYGVGWIIYYLSPTGTSENAPISCLTGATIFYIYREYILPFYRKERNKV